MNAVVPLASADRLCTSRHQPQGRSPQTRSQKKLNEKTKTSKPDAIFDFKMHETAFCGQRAYSASKPGAINARS